MRKLLRKMKRERMKRVSRSVVTVGLAAGLAAGGYLATCDQAQAFDSHTTTVGLKLSVDRETVSASDRRVVNIGIMGVDELGNVDINAEAGGSRIIAAVSSVLGNIGVGGATPGGAAGGRFDAQTTYVNVVNGTGAAYINYPTTAEGTDTVTVKLYEARNDSGLNTETRLIASRSFNVSVTKAAANAGILDIDQFTMAAGDPHGVNDNPVNPFSDATNIGMATARMTAGNAGGQLVVRAYTVNSARVYTADNNASGEVTVTFTGTNATPATAFGNKASGTTYTVTGTMTNGVATISLPATMTKAGQYKVVATMGDITSVPQTATNAVANTDYFVVAPETTPAKVSMSVDMSTVVRSTAANYVAGLHQATATVRLLDQFGNRIDPANVANTDTIQFTDANSKVTIPQTAFAAGVGSLTAAVTADTNGTASIVAKLKDSNTVADSDPVAMKVVSVGYALCTGGAGDAAGCTAAAALNGGNKTAGAVYNMWNAETTAMMLTDGSNFSANDSIVLDDGKETKTLSVDADADDVSSVQAMFTKATGGNIANFYLSDPDNEYGSMKVAAGYAIVAATPTSAKLTTDIGGNGDVLKEVPAAVQANGTYVATFNNQHFNWYDSFGNLNNIATGSIKYKTTVGTVATNDQVPGSNINTTITYPKTTTGEDALTFTFSGAPGIDPTTGLNGGDGVKVKFTAAAALSKFVTNPAADSAIELPINGIMPIEVYPASDDGKVVAQASGYKITYDTNGLQLQDETLGAVVPNGQISINFPTASAGRLALAVNALSVPGTYNVKFESLDGSVTKTVQVKVVEYTVPLSLGNTAITVATGATGDVNIIGGAAPYTVTSADTSVVTASVSGNKLTLTAVAQGGPVDVTVTDANDATAVVKVTVSDSGVVPPLGDSSAINGDGSAGTSATTFSGGVSVAGGAYSSSATVAQDTTLDIKVTATIDPADVGKKADMIVLAGINIDGVISWFIKPETDGAPWAQWFGDPAALTGFKTTDALLAEEEIHVFNGALSGFAGMQVQVFTAYRLEDGKVVYNQQPVIINVTE